MDGRDDGQEVDESTDPLVDDPPPPPFMLDETCTISVAGRTVRARANGSFSIPGVPAQPGLFRVRAVCERNGGLEHAASRFYNLQTETLTDIEFERGSVQPIPVFIELIEDFVEFEESADPVQLIAAATFPDGGGGRRALGGRRQHLDQQLARRGRCRWSRDC